MHKHNSTDIETKKKCEEENGGYKGNDDGYCAIYPHDNLVLVCVSGHVNASISILSGTTDKTPPNPPAI